MAHKADPEVAYRFANLAGFGDHAAAYAAYNVGLRSSSHGVVFAWSMRELRQLLFIRDLAEDGYFDETPDFGPLPPIVRRVS